MTEDEFRTKWDYEKPFFEKWGNNVLCAINQKLNETGKDYSSFVKIPAVVRVKDTQSLIDKAFYRSKTYEDPYFDIEDKVGVRYVVLLIEDIRFLCQIIESFTEWDIDPCKHFDNDKEKDPLLFSYQSVHYIVRPKNAFEIEGTEIPADTPCEIQVRTLLQHAHSELTHDAIYKSKQSIKPLVQRTVAKCMALIETTDDFFSFATKELNNGPLEEFKIIDRLDGVYQSFTGNRSHNQKSSITVWDEFQDLIDDDLISNIQSQLINADDFKYLSQIIKTRYADGGFYQQSTVLFLYWMLKFKKRRLLRDWPFSKGVLEPLASDLGVSILDE